MFAELARSFGVTFKNMFTPPVTVQYPEVKAPTAPRFHGRHQLNRYSDGLEKCVGCELCAWACPADAIFVRGADNTPDARFSPGERYGIDYQINYLRCIFCGLCIEACPTRALTMTNEYELASDSRESMIFTKEMLLAPLPEGAEETPHTDAEVAARGIEYYQNNFAGQLPLVSVASEYAADPRRKKARDGADLVTPPADPGTKAADGVAELPDGESLTTDDDEVIA